MIVPSNLLKPSAHDRLTGRSHIRLGLKVHGEPIVQHIIAVDTDIVLGIGGPGVLPVAGWEGAELCLISKDRWLALGPGMTLHMCHDTGADRMQGSFEELQSAGISFPLLVNVSRLNIGVTRSLTVLVEYIDHLLVTA